jgi:serine/threonine protein kinase
MVKGTVKAGRQDYSVYTRVDGPPHEVGDFGLATSSLAAAVEPSELAPHTITADAEMTLGLTLLSTFWTLLIILHTEVGTKLYIAPEVQSPKKGPRNHTKADLYSLGVRQSVTMWRGANTL